MTAQTVAVVIDVFRAFTTAAVAFNKGADHIHCVRDLDTARALAVESSNSFLMGEDHGLQPEAFDAGNSPAAVAGFDLTGKLVIQRTSNGTRGLVDATADQVLAASAVNATATAAYIASTWPDAAVEFVATEPGNEDQAAADFMASLLASERPDVAALSAELRRIADIEVAKWAAKLGPDHPEVLGYAADVEMCCAVDTLPIAMVGLRTDTGVTLQRG